VKIWIVSVGEPLPTDGKNTRLRRMGNLANCISLNGHNVEWFSVSFDHYKKVQRCDEDKDISVNDNFTMHLVFTPGYKKNVSFSRIIHHKAAGRNILNKMNDLEKPDIIITSMEPLEVSSAATEYGIKNSIPVVVDVRDLWPEIYFEVLPKSLNFILVPYVNYCRSILRKTMSKAYSIIGLSNGFLKYGLRFAEREKKHTDRIFPIAYPNYDYKSYKLDFQKYWNSNNLKNDDFLIVFFGNFGKQFNFEGIIEASNLLRDNPKIKFILCGNGEQLDNVKKRTQSNVIFPGWIEKEQILSLAANASLGVAPYINSKNYTQNTPNKFGEYLSANLPILVSVSGSMEDLLGEHQCGYRYQSGTELVDIINSYFNDRDKLANHSINARQLYEQQFNGDIAYERLLDYLIEVHDMYIEENHINTK
jgi:glycosyltransferase involved in cell wall biosynthesis